MGRSDSTSHEASEEEGRSPAPSPVTDAARQVIEGNHWFYGGIFKTYWAHHFHSVTHECYAVVAGRSRLLLGVGPLDGHGHGGGVEVELGRGDAIVLPVSRSVFDTFSFSLVITVSWSRCSGGSKERERGINEDFLWVLVVDDLLGGSEPLLCHLGGQL